MTADLDRTRPVCCSPQRRGCDEVRIHSCPPRAGQYNRPVAPCQGNLLTQAAGATKLKTSWLRHGQSQNVFTIMSSRVVLTREPLYDTTFRCPTSFYNARKIFFHIYATFIYNVDFCPVLDSIIKSSFILHTNY